MESRKGKTIIEFQQYLERIVRRYNARLRYLIFVVEPDGGLDYYYGCSYKNGRNMSNKHYDSVDQKLRKLTEEYDILVPEFVFSNNDQERTVFKHPTLSLDYIS